MLWPPAGEVSKLLEEEGVSLAELEPAPLDSLYVVTGRVGRAVSSPSTGCSPPGCPKGPDGWQKGPRPLTQALAASLFPRLASLGPSCASVSKMLELLTTGRWSSELTLTSHRSELPGQVVRQGGQSFASQASSRHTFKALGSMAHLRLRKQTLSNLRQRLLRGLGGQRPQHHLRPGLFPRCSSASAQEPTSHRGGGSGGYLEHVFRHAAQELFGIHVTEVTYRPLRSVGRAIAGPYALAQVTGPALPSPGSPGIAQRPLPTAPWYMGAVRSSWHTLCPDVSPHSKEGGLGLI